MYENLTALSSSAQAKRLAVLSLTKYARSLLEDTTSTVPCLKLKENPADERTASSDEADTLAQTTMPDEPVELVSGIAESLADTLGVKEEALAPFLVESISTALAYCGAMIDRAKEKLAEADIIEAAAI
jgi:hypothetical protein